MRVRVVVDDVAADVGVDERSDAELRTELGARVAAALVRADRSGVLWSGGGAPSAEALDPEAVGGLVTGAVQQTFGPREEP